MKLRVLSRFNIRPKGKFKFLYLGEGRQSPGANSQGLYFFSSLLCLDDKCCGGGKPFKYFFLIVIKRQYFGYFWGD